MLPLIFVQPFHLYIEHGVDINLHPASLFHQSRQCTFVGLFDLAQAFKNSSSPTYLSNALSSSRLAVQAKPIFSVIKSDRRGLLSISHRRGVTPLVTLRNFSCRAGKNPAKPCFSKAHYEARQRR